MSQGNETGRFINGKAMAAEILQALTPNERQAILKHIRVRDPGMATDLVQQSFSFKSISNLDSHDLIRVSNYVDARIFGIAIKGVALENQREVLRKLDRDYAEIAYTSLTSHQANDMKNIKRAQEKVLGVMSSLYKERQISI